MRKLLVCFSLLIVSLAAVSTRAATPVRIEEVARIGVLEGAPEYMFGQLGFVCALRDGSVIVADGQAEQIRAYDAAGEFLRDIGRAGEGPGEYQRMRGMIVLPKGELVVLSSPGRLTYFNVESGEFLRDLRIPSYLHTARMLEYDNDGFVYVKDTQGDPEPDQEWRIVWMKVNSAGDVVDRVAIPAENATAKSFTLIFPEGARRNFVVGTMSTWSPAGYLVSGRNDRYSFVIHRDPDPIVVSRDVAAVRLGGAERDEWKAWARHFNGGFEIPETKPVFRGLNVDCDGRIWVERYVEARHLTVPARAPGDKRPLSSWREPATFDVFDAEGRFQGTVELPDFTGRAAFAGEHIWAVQTTDDGERLVHWRMSGLGGGGME